MYAHSLNVAQPQTSPRIWDCFRKLTASGSPLTATCSCGTMWMGASSPLIFMTHFNASYSQELSSFVDQPDVITHVALVKPKNGVFIDEITTLLVICTPITVLLIGVSTTPVPGPNGQTRKEIKMYATDMSIACDVEMSAVVGTPDGRIFMAGSQDGNLYELHYQEKEGWFGKRVQLINHSVGGVQSLLPRIGASNADGTFCGVLRQLSLIVSQTGSCPSSPTQPGIASIL